MLMLDNLDTFAALVIVFAIARKTQLCVTHLIITATFSAIL
jgi:hypothetical protein